ncbi:MAG: hypothetical protein ABIL09_11050 [Gemmatimonadota bacterium]
MAVHPVALPDRVQQILRRQQSQLDKVAPRHRRRLLEIALDTRRGLERQLRAAAADRYTAQETRVLLLQVNGIVQALAAQFGSRVGEELKQIGANAATVGRESLQLQINYWEQHFRGTIRRTARVELAGDVLDDGLLEYYRSSRERYGIQAIRRMRDAMAMSTLSGETVAQTTEKLMDSMDLSRGWAERIVRTEQSVAVHRRQLLDMKEMFEGEEDEWRKELVATFDQRTYPDSKFVHGQRRKMDELFRDNMGRKYLHPPNRPNDREVMVFVPADEPPAEPSTALPEPPPPTPPPPTPPPPPKPKPAPPETFSGELDVSGLKYEPSIRPSLVAPTGAATTKRALDMERLRRLADDPAADPAALRRELNTLVEHYGLAVPTSEKGLQIEERNGIGLGSVNDDGRIRIGSDYRKLESTRDRLHVMVHETIHTTSRKERSAAHLHGKFWEEVSTELAARRIMADMGLDSRLTGGGIGAYDEWIWPTQDVISRIADAESKAAGEKFGQGPWGIFTVRNHNDASPNMRALLADASLHMRRTQGPVSTEPDQLLDRFVDGIMAQKPFSRRPDLRHKVRHELREMALDELDI